MPESTLTLRQSRLYPPPSQGLRIWPQKWLPGFAGNLPLLILYFTLIYVRVMNTEKRKTNESRSAVFAYLLPPAIQFRIAFNGIGNAFSLKMKFDVNLSNIK
jgi:hypothetical protein